FHDERAARFQRFRGKAEHTVRERLFPGFVTRFDATELGREVREKHVGLATAKDLYLRLYRRAGHVAAQCDNVALGKGDDRLYVDPNDFSARPHLPGCHLQPAARPRTEIDDPIAAPEEPRAPRQLFNLERGA